MTALIMANGEYSDPNWYQQKVHYYSYVICADGGADAAKRIGIMPDLIIGDLDSIFESDVHTCQKKAFSSVYFLRQKTIPIPILLWMQP